MGLKSSDTLKLSFNKVKGMDIYGVKTGDTLKAVLTR